MRLTKLSDGGGAELPYLLPDVRGQGGEGASGDLPGSSGQLLLHQPGQLSLHIFY
jgi:hypothetical protein